ncbi:MAG: retention module-containing protein [Zoogloeaceae bacterium]|nr:retention module-containing protein [Zoogloeaceae bacterium]
MADVLPIATVVAVVGKAFARDTDGNLRSLKPGDVLREGDTVITAAGDRVELALENGEPLFVQPNQTVQMTAELSDLTKPDASESAVASAEVDRVIQTLEQGGDLNAELDAPAAGLAGGTGGDGNSFVRLLRIVESTEPLAFEFGTARGDIELPFNGLVGDNQDLPTAVPDTAQTERDHAVVINVLENDRSTAGGLHIVAATAGTGQVVINPDGTLTYTPAPGFTGGDTISYTIVDARGQSSTTTVTVSVTLPNDVPVATDDTLAAVEDTPLTGTLATNDTPSGDGGNVWALASGPANGSVTVNADGTFSYTPDANYNGPDSFTYTITDADGDVSTATATINVAPVNDVPVATDDTLAAVEDTPLTGTLAANDTPSGDGGNVWALASGPANGSVTVNADGTFSYTPDANYNGPDSFTYTITDANGDVSTATATINVAPVNDVPVAADDTLAAVEDTPLTGSLAANDTPSGDGGNVWALASGPANGSVTVNADGTFSYTPNANYNGPDSFTYTITDADGDVSTATATINVAPVNDVPVAADDTLAVFEDTPLTGTLAANDTPSGDGGNVWALASGPANGSVTVNPDGTFSYTPNANYNGPDSFTYTITDADGDVSTATATINVAPVNDVPVATDDTLAAVEDTPLTGTLAANDTPSGDGGNVWALASGPANGSVTVNPDGTFSYTPDANYNGPDSFTYTITDADGDVSTATATINVAPVNDVPVAADDTLAAFEDTPLTGTLAANDTPSGDGGNVWALASGPANGSVTVNADGTFSYTPNANYNGPDSFTYTITDADGDVSTATATINVAPTSDAPIAQDDVATTAEDTPVIIDVLGNDSDPDGDTLTITEIGGQPISVGNPVTIPEGSVALNPDGTLTFTPNPNFNGPVSFDYTVTDGTTPVTATVDVTVTAVNDVPVAADDVLAAVEDTPLTGTLAANDTPSGDGGNVWALASGPANGSVTVNPDGTFSYTPDANYNGPDSFTYTITDADGDVSTATATINVAPTSDAPIAQDDVATTAEDTPVIIDVLGNDSDPDGDTLTITEIGGQPISVGNPVTIPEGSVALNPDGTLTFTPNPNFNGPVSFDYTVTDGTTPVTATVDVTVTAVNDVPVATDDTLAAVEDTPLTGTLAANDTPSGDGGNVWALASGPANGSVTVNPDGTFSYTPDANYNGPDSFTYTITDADGDVSTATATINVAPVNDVPVAADDTLAAVEDTPLTGTLAANDTPSGDGGNVWALASGPANGSVTVNPDGTFSYTPDANYNGPDSFTYTITDADGDVSTATATINVAPTSDAPIAQDDVATTAEDTPVIIDVLGNDSDPDGDTLTITEIGGQPISVGNPVTIPEGSVALNPDGTLTFTPNPNFNGPVSFDGRRRRRFDATRSPTARRR